MILETERLILKPGTLEIGRAELRNRTEFANLLDAEVPWDWPPPLNDETSMTYFCNYMENNPDSEGWSEWYFLLKTTSGKPAVIGNGGFKGKPDSLGQVEIGYSIMKEYQGRGFATEAMRTLIEFAFSDKNVTGIIAHTFPELILSIRVLEKLGLVYTGPGEEKGTIKFQMLREKWSNL